jgi:transposase
MDEISVRKGYRDFVTLVSHVDTGNLLEVIDSHKQSEIIDVLKQQPFDGICNYFMSRTTSGVMEGINNKAKLILRQGYGFSDFEHFRARLLGSFSD